MSKLLASEACLLCDYSKSLPDQPDDEKGNDEVAKWMSSRLPCPECGGGMYRKVYREPRPKPIQFYKCLKCGDIAAEGCCSCPSPSSADAEAPE